MVDSLKKLARQVKAPGSRSVSEDDVQFGVNPIDELRRTINTQTYTPEQAAENRQRSLWEALSIIPGPGNVISAHDAYTGAGDAYGAFQSGDYKGGALASALAGLSGAGAVFGLPFGRHMKHAAEAGADTLNAIPAWHGSPHDFDKFEWSPRTAGTGEGAQAYGHGLYFAGNPDVAATYQKALSPILVDGKPIDKNAPFAVQQYLGTKMRGELDARIAQQEKDIAHLEQSRLRPDILDNPNTLAMVDDMLAHQRANLSVMKDVNAMDTRSAGHLYHTELDVEPEDLLDWDKPLSQQSEKVKAAISGTPEGKALFDQQALVFQLQSRLDELKTQRMTPEWRAEAAPLSQQLLRERNKLQHLEARFEDYKTLTGSPAATQALREAGIPGIRFLDQGSRGAGQGTSNYVIFDDSLVKILGKE